MEKQMKLLTCLTKPLVLFVLLFTLGVGEDNFTPTKKYGKFRNPETGEYCSDKRDFLLYIKDEKGKYLTEEGYRVTKLYARILIRRKK